MKAKKLRPEVSGCVLKIFPRQTQEEMILKRPTSESLRLLEATTDDSLVRLLGQGRGCECANLGAPSGVLTTLILSTYESE